MTEVETKYLPAAWLDEVVPPAQSHPNLFVHHSEASGWHLRDPDEDEEEAFDGGWFTKIQPGDVVPFSANRVFGDFVITINADGSYSTDRPVPIEANCFRLDHDNDTISDSIAMLIEGCPEGSADIDAYWWSNEEYLFRFHVIDGKGAFVPEGVRQ